MQLCSIYPASYFSIFPSLGEGWGRPSPKEVHQPATCPRASQYGSQAVTKLSYTDRAKSWIQPCTGWRQWATRVIHLLHVNSCRSTLFIKYTGKIWPAIKVNSKSSFTKIDDHTHLSWSPSHRRDHMQDLIAYKSWVSTAINIFRIFQCFSIASLPISIQLDAHTPLLKDFMFEIGKLLGKLKLRLLEAKTVIIGSAYTSFSTAVFPVQSLPTLLRACICHSSDSYPRIAQYNYKYWKIFSLML